jgi:copper(I)-binding protein
MNAVHRLLVAAAAILMAANPAANAAAAGGRLEIERAWARATAPGATVGAAYLVIANRSKHSDRLLSLSCARATAEVHGTIRDLDQVKMRRIDPLHVAAGERLVMEPGGTHVMLLGLKSPLKQGETLPLTLRFERAGEIVVNVGVLAATAGTQAPR